MTQERLDQLLGLFHQRARIARTFGMQLSFTAEGNAVVDLPYNPSLDHGLGGVHGGVYCTLLDTAGWFTAAARQEPGIWIATAEMSVHLLAPARETALRAEGRILKAGSRQTICEMRLFDGEGQLVAHATGTFVALPGVAWE
jgi:uncharacterized protein (TIGR00369 family)